MPFSSGTFSLFTPGNPVVTGTTISSSWANSTLSDIATGLSTAILKDGTQTITANIPLGGFRITGLGAGTAVTDAARVSQVQNSGFTSLTSVAGTNTITATATPTPAAYVVGQVFEGIAAATNTTAATLNVSGLGAGAVQVAGAALTGGELIINGPFRVFVSAVTPVFQLIANGQVGPFLDTNPLVKGSSDGTKKVRIEVDGLTTATTRVWTAADLDIAVGKQPTRTVLTSGTGATYNTPTGATRLDVMMIGGGSGGGAQNTNNGSAGTATTFGGSLTAGAGSVGVTNGGAGGAGGTSSGGDVNLAGGQGSSGAATATANTIMLGGVGGNSALGGAGAGTHDANGGNAAANTGSGGAGGGGSSATNSGGGGGAGGYLRKLLVAPATTFTYTVGAGGAGGAAGVTAGGNGAAGIIIVDEYYN